MQILRQLPIALFLALAACGGPEPSACDGDGVSASGAWLRAAGEGQPMSAAYVELCNGADAPDKLVAAHFDGANAAEIHITSMDEDGMASMAPAEGGLALAPHEKTALAPGGAHIMLIGLSAPIAAGEEAAITLEFENAEPMTVMFKAMSPAEAAAHQGH
ncbi:copper chaperone PCu(A)C [Hyphococcus luteus]|nr:copper chaperone PCu(A)C [Marinicaulis flavus]